MQPRQVVLVDTNIIIEAVRTRCWNAIKAHFQIVTVEKCCEEARTGAAHRPGYVAVDTRALRDRLDVVGVTDVELATLALRDAESFQLDAGERHLWAHALGRADDWRACCADRAAVNAAIRLAWKDRLISLEALANHAGARAAVKALKRQFSSARLSEWCTAALLERGLE